LAIASFELQEKGKQEGSGSARVRLNGLNPHTGPIFFDHPIDSAFEAKHVTEFVENIRRGYERVSPLSGGKTELPEAATINPWDGKDAEVRL